MTEGAVSQRLLLPTVGSGVLLLAAVSTWALSEPGNSAGWWLVGLSLAVAFGAFMGSMKQSRPVANGFWGAVLAHVIFVPVTTVTKLALQKPVEVDHTLDLLAFTLLSALSMIVSRWWVLRDRG
jgi:hypothetical protein